MSNQTHLDGKKLPLKTRWVLLRNRILGSARFQNWAAKTPVIRGIARRKAAAQFDLIAGFVYSQLLYVFVKSGLPEYLRPGLRSLPEIADQAGLDGAAAERLIRATDALAITESPQPGLWTLGEVGAALSANHGAMAMIEHHILLYRDLADPFALLSRQGGQDSALSAYWQYAQDGAADEENSRSYSELMAATQPMVSAQILRRYDFARHDKMLDIGGGAGAFVTAVAEAAPRLHLGIFDLPEVAPHSSAKLSRSSIGERVTVHTGNFKQDDLPRGYDLITLIRILHDHDDDVAQQLLAKIHAALPDKGRLLIAEPMAGTKGAEPMGDAYFGLYLWAMGSGRPRSMHENKQMLMNAGFSRVQTVKTNLPIIAKAIITEK